MRFSYLRTWLFIVMNLTFLVWIIPWVSASESSIINNILKIKTYDHRNDGSFVFTSYGSAIAIDASHILTNAHVILNSDGEVMWNYEICFSDNFENVPKCRDIAKLIAYDTVTDLAILKLQKTNNLSPFTLASTKIAIGSYVSMYWYPGIGGETITRTDGKIAGFEQSMYKIDGSIDHGNSGGGAFNNSWELVGMPTAVASDNASLGYMVSIKKIQEFLSKKTTNYEIYTEDLDPGFVDFIKRNQSYNSIAAKYSWNDLFVRNPRFYWFHLKNAMISSDNTMMHWTFVDANERVKFILSCTNDAGRILGWQARIRWFDSEKRQYPTWDMSLLDEDKYLSIYSVSKWYKPWVVMYYKWYDACFVDLEYQDIKKDTKSLNKAIQFIKKWVSFSGKYKLKDSQINKYFSLQNSPENIRVIRSIDSLWAESILLGLEYSSWNWMNSVIEWKNYATLDELGDILGADFNEIKNWNEYIAFGVKSGVDPSRIQTIRLANNQKWLLYSVYNSEKKNTSISFEYTYITPEWRYAYINWSVTMNGNFMPNASQFENLFASLEFPGHSIFQ